MTPKIRFNLQNQIQMLTEIFIVLFAYAFYEVILKSLVPLLILKFQHGDSMDLFYFPVLGVFRILKRADQTKDNNQYVRDLKSKHPKVKFIGTNYGLKPFILFIEPQYLKSISQDHQKYIHASDMMDEDLMSKGLLAADGPKAKHMRALLGPQFHFDSLKRRVPLVNQIYEQRVKNLPLDVPIRALEFASAITGDVIIQTFFGQKIETINGKEPQVEIVNIFAAYGQTIKRNKWHMIKGVFLGRNSWKYLLNAEEKRVLQKSQKLKDVAIDIIEKRIKLKQEQKEQNIPWKSDDFLDVHCNDMLLTGGITKQEIVHQFITFFFAGTDTTSNLVTSSLYYLGLYPESQEEIRNEILKVLNGNSEVEFEHLSQFPLLSSFINETLRKSTPAPILISRQPIEDHTIVDVKVKKGWNITYYIMPAMQNPEIFQNPHEFQPKRFLDSKIENSHAFTPFSSGARNCIGQHLALIEAKVILARLISSFKISLKTKDVRWLSVFLYTYRPDDIIIFTKI